MMKPLANKSWGKLFILFTLFFQFQSAAIFAEEIIVAAAANLQFALEEIKTAFEKQSGIPIKTVVSSSGQLSAQITNGAPFDVFLSADMKYPDSLFAGGRAVHPLKIYAYGSLVLWTCKEINLADTLRTLVETAEKIAIASPQHAPYGSAAVEALKHYKLYEIAAPKLVYGRSISQVNQYILSRAVDWGITAKSTVFSPDISSRGTWIEIDPAAYTPVAQGAVILQHGQENHPEATQAFFDFLFSETARQIFRNHGYQLP